MKNEQLGEKIQFKHMKENLGKESTKTLKNFT